MPGILRSGSNEHENDLMKARLAREIESANETQQRSQRDRTRDHQSRAQYRNDIR